jgi:hypothetical protein
MKSIKIGDLYVALAVSAQMGPRPKCHACKQTIEKDEERIRFNTSQDAAPKFFHRVCARKIAHGLLFIAA